MGNHSLRMCPCFGDGDKGGFADSSIEQHKEETLNDSLNVADVHVRSSSSEDGCNEIGVTPINICPRTDTAISSPSSKRVVVPYSEPQYVLPGSADYGMAPNTEDQGKIFPKKQGCTSTEMHVPSGSENLDSRCRSENFAHSDLSDYVRAFASPPDSPRSSALKMEENSCSKGFDKKQRVSCNPTNKTDRNKSSDLFLSGTSQEKPADDNAPFSDVSSCSVTDSLLLSNKTNLDAFPQELSSRLKMSQKLPKSSDSGDTAGTSGILSELPLNSKPGLKKRVSFSTEVTIIRPPNLASLSNCDMDDISIVSSSTSVEQRSLSDASESGIKDAYHCMPQFRQPAADYVGFRNRLQILCVSLENVWFSGNIILGTVKVQRLSHRSSVFLRCTYDAWETYVDIPATNTPAVFPTQYTTYSFEVCMPVPGKNTTRIIFAVCLKAGNQIYWDNNDGRNYEIVFTPRT